MLNRPARMLRIVLMVLLIFPLLCFSSVAFAQKKGMDALDQEGLREVSGENVVHDKVSSQLFDRMANENVYASPVFRNDRTDTSPLGSLFLGYSYLYPLLLPILDDQEDKFFRFVHRENRFLIRNQQFTQTSPETSLNAGTNRSLDLSIGSLPDRIGDLYDF